MSCQCPLFCHFFVFIFVYGPVRHLQIFLLAVVAHTSATLAQISTNLENQFCIKTARLL